MDLIAQIRITGFAAALFLCLMAQLPAVVPLRWWFSATGIGFCAALLDWSIGGPAEPRVASILFLCLCAQLGCIAAGLLWQSSKLKHAKAAFAASILLGFLLLTVSGNSAGRLAASRCLISLIILTVLVAYMARHRERHPFAVSIISAVLLLGIMRELLGVAVAMHWAEPSFLPLIFSVSDFFGPCVSAIALLFIAFSDIALRDAQLHRRAEHLRQLVDIHRSRNLRNRPRRTDHLRQCHGRRDAGRRRRNSLRCLDSGKTQGR